VGRELNCIWLCHGNWYRTEIGHGRDVGRAPYVGRLQSVGRAYFLVGLVPGRVI
jgi:hypothetical protein